MRRRFLAYGLRHRHSKMWLSESGVPLPSVEDAKRFTTWDRASTFRHRHLEAFAPLWEVKVIPDAPEPESGAAA